MSAVCAVGQGPSSSAAATIHFQAHAIARATSRMNVAFATGRASSSPSAIARATWRTSAVFVVAMAPMH